MTTAATMIGTMSLARASATTMAVSTTKSRTTNDRARPSKPKQLQLSRNGDYFSMRQSGTNQSKTAISLTICIYIYTFMYMYMIKTYVYVYIYIHSYVHTHTHVENSFSPACSKPFQPHAALVSAPGIQVAASETRTHRISQISAGFVHGVLALWLHA